MSSCDTWPRHDRDIMAITVNRWAHGYTYYHHTLWDGDVPEDKRINVVSRKTFGNITIVNTDAGGDAQVPFAIEQAYRATKELLDGTPSGRFVIPPTG